MELDHQQLQKIHRIGERYGLRLLLLFGSAVSGNLHPGSDIDIAAQFPDIKVGREQMIDLAASLQELFPEREVDIALINGADPLFLKKILESRQLVFGDAGRLAELEMYAYKRYIDHKRYLKLEQEYVRGLLERMKKGAA